MTLAVRGLTVVYGGSKGCAPAVRGLDLDIPAGGSVGLVGESGSGKTTVVRAVLGLLPEGATATGSIMLDGQELVGARPGLLQALRGRRLAVVPQGAMAGLHPCHRARDQVEEVARLRSGMPAAVARARAGRLLVEVGLPPDAARAFPHQLSGGMRQRVALAMALAVEPQILIADEPTTGLDAVTQALFLRLLRDQQSERGFALLLVSHDLRAVQRLCLQLAVCYAGRVVERGPTDRVVATPAHPYTAGLLSAVPDLDTRRWAAVPGEAPDVTRSSPGCAFAPRCPAVMSICAEDPPEADVGEGQRAACHLHTRGCATLPLFPPVAIRSARAAPGSQPVVEVSDVVKRFGGRGRHVLALAGVTLRVAAGEVVGLVGASGSGKTTLARVLVGLERIDAGRIIVAGNVVNGLRGRELRAHRRRVALVHQDPYASLHPALPVAALVGEPLAIAGVPRRDHRERVEFALAAAGLSPALLHRRPGELSGGQRQRVALARALVADPVLLIADEPTSMLDASLRAGVAEVLAHLRSDRGLAVVLITHDLAEAAQICDRLVVLDAGKVVEDGPSADLLSQPAAPATRALVAVARDPLARVAPAAVPRASRAQ